MNTSVKIQKRMTQAQKQSFLSLGTQASILLNLLRDEAG
jgi:hypothetical protein